MRIRTLVLATTLFSLVLTLNSDAGVDGYYRYPALHGNDVFFAMEGDLWKVSASGGLANRLTTHAGDELYTTISPGGQWLAFQARYQGNADVYVMSLQGGEPRRLTFHPSTDAPITWKDDNTLVFRSLRESFHGWEFLLYEISVDGGQPKKIEMGPAAIASFSEDGAHVAFNRLSREFRNWKRYQGGTAQDIWLGNLNTNQFSKLTKWEGTDRFPMWFDGRIYFLSDRNGTMNLYRMNKDGSNVQPVTTHTRFDIRWPSMHKGRIVYMLAGDIWVMDVRNGENHKINITVPTDRIRNQPRFENPAGTVDGIALNKEGNRIAVSSRGEIWHAPTKEGRRVQMTRSSGVRDRLPAFSPDGETLVYISDRSGEQELHVQATDVSESEATALTAEEQGWIFPPVWSPDGKTIAYADLRQALYIVDVETQVHTTVVKSDSWEITEYTFSPDGKWLAYTLPSYKQPNSIYVYNLESGESHPITTPFTSDYSPAWDPEGKYLYFLSDRTLNPLHGDLDYQYVNPKTTKPYVVILQEDGFSPFLPDEVKNAKPEEEEEPASDEVESASADAPEDLPTEDSSDGDESSDEEATEESDLPEVVIDLEGIQHRVVEVPVTADNYGGLSAIEGKILFMKYPLSGRRGQFNSGETRSLHAYDFAAQALETYVDSLRTYALSGDYKRLAVWVGNTVTVVDAASKPNLSSSKETIALNEFSLRVNPQEEWEQIFYEAWRLQRDFFWAETMVGVDWDDMKAKYEALLPRISTRHELNDLIGQMIAELGTSHTYISGGDLQGTGGIGIGHLGAAIEWDAENGMNRFVKIYRPDPWENSISAPLLQNHVDVTEGDWLIAINGHRLQETDNVYDWLMDQAGEEVLLTVAPADNPEDERDVQITALGSQNELIYRDWVRSNREYVESVSGGRYGYIHIPDMGARGLVEFTKAFYPQVNRDGLVIDVRYNGGGNVSQLVIDRLKRNLWAFMKPRRGEMSTYPAAVHIGHKVVLTNEKAGSDGDIFPESFQILGLGPVIGMRSWGGVVGIRSNKPFIDGGMSTQPEFAWWYPEKGWELENRGVEPDIEIDILPEDWIADKDPQLERAVRELDRMSSEQPVIRHQPPSYPNRAKW